MRSILELISKHSDANSIIPIIAVVAVVFVIALYTIFKAKWVKYLASVMIIIVGLVIFYSGYKNMLEIAGIDQMAFGSKVLVFGIVSLLFSCIMGIFDSFAKMFKRPGKKTKVNKTKSKGFLAKKNDIPEASVKDN